ncbi:MAG: DUF1801 domain-containing protein [Cytophagales bacterium]|nr:MAG: DUF1801 domain-containing protein [Cytophagales bacterium]
MANQTNKLSSEVTAFLDGQNHPLREEIEQFRNCILTANTDLTEIIKWNNPNYCFEGKDRITMRIQPPKQLQLIFHCGAKVQEEPKEKLIKEFFDMLTWKTNDRAIATFNDMEAIKNGQSDLTKIVNEWIKVTSR